jgi:hypothetical protein
MRIVSHVAIEVFRRPKRLSTPKQFICSMRSERFPGMDNAVEPVLRMDFDQPVYMVRHYTPSEYRITLTVKPQQCSLDQFGNIGGREITAPVPLIERSVSLSDTLVPRRFAISFLR